MRNSFLQQAGGSFPDPPDTDEDDVTYDDDEWTDVKPTTKEIVK